MVHKIMVYLINFRYRVSRCTCISANHACLLNVILWKFFNLIHIAPIHSS